MQALTALKKWWQVNGKFRSDVLRQALNEIERNDIGGDLLKQLEKLDRLERSRRSSNV